MLLVNPSVQCLPVALEPGPFVGVVADGKFQQAIIQVRERLLKVPGNAKTLRGDHPRLRARGFQALRRCEHGPHDQRQKKPDCQYEAGQSQSYACVHRGHQFVANKLPSAIPVHQFHAGILFQIDVRSAMGCTQSMIPQRNSRYLLPLALLLSAFAARADVKLPGLFSDNIVLQQGIRVPVWGWAEDGEKVTVTFRGKAISTSAKNGKWRVSLPSQKGGGPETLTVEGRNSIELKNVLVGEVWVCSGQSNMEWPLSKSFEAEKDIADSTDPNIRLFTVPKLKADEPVNDLKASWQECNPESVKGFSAVAYYFGRDLQKARGVPVGLIHTSWGGSPAEVWMSKDVLESNPAYEAEILDPYPAALKHYQEELAKWEKEAAELTKESARPTGGRPRAPWKPTEPYNGMIAPLIPCAIKGAIWYQGESNAERAGQYRALFPDLIRNWRRDWGQGDFPFLAVQLAPWDKNKKRSIEEITAAPGDSDWAELRETQLRA